MSLHKLLKKQLNKFFTEEQQQSPALKSFIDQINDSYHSFEKDIELMNHAFHLAEEDYYGILSSLRTEHELKKVSIDRLKEALVQIDKENELNFERNNNELLSVVDFVKEQILKRKQSEESLSRALLLLTTLLSNLNSAILVEDENRKVLYSNQLFGETFNIPIPPEQLVGFDCNLAAEQSKTLFSEPDKFIERTNEILQARQAVSKEKYHLTNGRILERDYIPIFINNTYKGNLWDYKDITEQILAENKLKDLSNMQQAILNGTDYSIIFTDTNGTILSFNHGAEKMLGYTADEMIGKKTPELIHDPQEVVDRALILSKELNKSIKPGFEVFVAKSRYNVVDTNEWSYIKKNGSVITVQLSVSSIRNSSGQIIGFLGIAHDVTEQKNAEKALKLSEERYRNMVERSTDIIYKTNKYGNFTYANPVAEKITGYSQKELLTMHFSDLVREDKKRETALFYRNQIQDKKNNTYYEFPIITKHGEERWIGQSVQLSLIEANDYEINALAIDITSRINYERTILLQKEKYQNIIANMNLGLLEVDLNEKIQFANPGFCSISGYTQKELIGNKASELFLYEFQENFTEEKTKKRIAGLSDMYEVAVKNKKGEMRWWIISGAPNYDNTGKLIGSIGIHLDVTEKKQLELELELAKSKAEESSKAKEAFLANMSHEIRTPLNAIIGMIRELKKENLNKQQNEYVGNVSVASQHLLSVLNNILDISKIEAGELQLDSHHFNVAATIEEVRSIMITKFEEKNLKFEIDFKGEKDLYFIGDSSRLRQILLNLIGNSIKFTDKGGVKLEYHSVKFHENYHALYMTIADTGIGMDEKYLKNIFNKFSQEDSSTSRKYGGSGLGMAITYELVQIMNGNISISSEKNIGTSVSLYFLLPLGEPEKIETVESGTTNDLSNINILLVEDNEFNRAVACNTLNFYNCSITEAVNGYDAIEKLRNSHKFDAVLMDLQMPILDGFEATKIIRTELNLNIPIIALTANAFKSELEQCIKIGMNDYVTKPFEEEKLVNTIYKWVNAENLTINTAKQAVNDTEIKERLYSLEQLYTLSRNDDSYVRKMVNIFIEQTRPALDEITRNYNEQNLIEVGRIVHRIKPSIDGMGIKILKSTTREIETMAKEGMDNKELWNKIMYLNSILNIVFQQLNEDGFK